MVDTSRPFDDPAMFNDRPIVCEIRPVSKDNLNTVPIEVKHSGVEVAVLIASRGRSTIRTTTSSQGCGVKISNSRATRSGESNVCGARFYSGVLSITVLFDVQMTRPTLAFLDIRRNRRRVCQIQFDVQTLQCSDNPKAGGLRGKTRLNLGDEKRSVQYGRLASLRIGGEQKLDERTAICSRHPRRILGSRGEGCSNCGRCYMQVENGGRLAMVERSRSAGYDTKVYI